MKNFKAISRAVGVTAAVVLMVSGVTFALLQTVQNKLTGNTIQTSSANLQLSTDGINFSNSEPGFSFTGLIPGGSPTPQPGYNITFKNIGSAPLNLKLAVTSTPANVDNVDLSKVNIVLTPSAGPPQTFSLKSLVEAGLSGNGLDVATPTPLLVGNRATFTIQTSMSTDALSGTSANLSKIDFAFTGVAVSS
jgi:hypothetical protein